MKQDWIISGYEMVAKSGFSGLKIEPLARTMNKNKSSFYFHFIDLDLFTYDLLNYHVESLKLLAFKESKAKRVNPDLIEILLDHKIDILFNQQLRFNNSKLCSTHKCNKLII
ncbi:TetR/AcrR family transcriptional regulator [Flavobacterium sp.]|jgi:hypothetical protein|uniref:TetR/AcrR family transcriptional regulator n=1 Tax=Flavobacterium sp. TaxID=239 RepID=UPI0022C800F3|nr:TetR/AcrR family transcriptional regulator [Flavobacterium sp.]MCZ8145949.1 TetR/AcrR family transcriptional regulator [Flavobacterium sp.]MCZ8367737.1 TetR/AcrR family transcriptional regulator [Flavobacterium sp.]